MTPKPIYRCARCGCELQGRAEFCVTCYDWIYRPCPNCTRQGTDSVYRVVKKGKPTRPRDCTVCQNKRWVRYEFKPYLP